MSAATGVEQYTIRRQVIRLFGAGFHIYDAQGGLVGYCNQKGFRLREDIRVYTDESRTEELLVISTTSVWDISGSYTVRLKDGAPIGAFKRRGVKSMLRDEWTVFGHDGVEIGTVREDSGVRAFFRRAHDGLATLMPQSYLVNASDGRLIATYRTHFNPFIYRLGVAIHETDEQFDDLLLLAGGCLLGAIEGRQ